MGSAISGYLGGLFCRKFLLRSAPTNGGAPLKWCSAINHIIPKEETSIFTKLVQVCLLLLLCRVVENSMC